MYYCKLLETEYSFRGAKGALTRYEKQMKRELELISESEKTGSKYYLGEPIFLQRCTIEKELREIKYERIKIKRLENKIK